MKEILPGIYEWSWFSKEKGLDFNGHLVVEGDDRVIIDPPPMAEQDLAAVERLGPVTGIIVTNRDHVREAEDLRRRFKAPVLAPAADASQIEIPTDPTFHEGDSLPGGIQVIRIPDAKSPGESALYIARNKGVMILGDALIGKPAGALNLLPPEKFKDPKKAREGIRVLLSFRFDAVLVGDGRSIVTGGRAAVEAFLNAAS